MISLRWEKLVHLVRKPWPTEGCHPGSAATALPTRSRPRGEGQTLRRARKNPLRTRPPHGDGANRMVLFNRRQSSPGCVAGAALGVERKACKNSAVLQTPMGAGPPQKQPGAAGDSWLQTGRRRGGKAYSLYQERTKVCVQPEHENQGMGKRCQRHRGGHGTLRH